MVIQTKSTPKAPIIPAQP
jgi:hypothetical protein